MAPSAVDCLSLPDERSAGWENLQGFILVWCIYKKSQMETCSANLEMFYCNEKRNILYSVVLVIKGSNPYEQHLFYRKYMLNRKGTNKILYAVTQVKCKNVNWFETFKKKFIRRTVQFDIKRLASLASYGFLHDKT